MTGRAGCAFIPQPSACFKSSYQLQTHLQAQEALAWLQGSRLCPQELSANTLCIHCSVSEQFHISIISTGICTNEFGQCYFNIPSHSYILNS